jgi:seryl-tRNA synthetase
MIDIKLIRENPELVKQGIRNKNENDTLDELLKLDEERRAIIIDVEELKAKRNQVSAKIPQMKKAGKDVSKVLAEMKQVSDHI